MAILHVAARTRLAGSESRCWPSRWSSGSCWGHSPAPSSGDDGTQRWCHPPWRPEQVTDGSSSYSFMCSLTFPNMLWLNLGVTKYYQTLQLHLDNFQLISLDLQPVKQHHCAWMLDQFHCFRQSHNQHRSSVIYWVGQITCFTKLSLVVGVGGDT